MIKQRHKKILVAMDIGNTSIHIGVFSNSRIVKRFRIDTHKDSSVISKNLLKSLRPYMNSDISVIISSVVPKVTGLMKKIIHSLLRIRPLVLGEDLNIPIKNLYKNPKQVGSDRLVNAYACRELYGAPAVIVDFGTATTFDYLNKDGEYEGGLISPGIGITLDALAEKTALLPRVRLERPKNLIGKNTQDSIRSGVINGLACMCDGLIEKIKLQIKTPPFILATGGLAGIFCCYSKYINKIDQDLTLKGLYLLLLESQKSKQI
jgi:type III pantothenate kinase